LFVRLKDEREKSVQEIVNGPQGLRAQFFNNIEGAIAIAQIPKAIDRSFNSAFQLVIQSDDLTALNGFVTEFTRKLRQSGFLQNVQSSFEMNKPELQIEINRNRAAALGVSIEDISRTLQIMFGGLDLSRIKKEGKEYEVIAQLARSSRQRPEDLDQLYVRNNRGELIQLNNLVMRESSAAPNRIEHYNRIRSTTVSGSVVGMPLGTAMEKVEAMLREDLPAGFLYTFAGEARDLRESANEVFFVLVLALIIVYMVLAAQFESTIHPFTVILAVPLAGVGAFGLIWLLNWLGKVGLITPIPAMTMNLFTQIGLVLLIGLVTKNSILLVEFANQKRENGASARDAMIEAGVVRLRPILMTAFSTIAGILPIAIGFGAGAESRRPMGVAVVGGMLTSTFLTLIVIPVIYTLFSDIAAWVARKQGASDQGAVGVPEPAGK
jgi:multidrug efflux pump